MEPAHRVEEEAGVHDLTESDAGSNSRFRIRVIVGSALLVGLAFVQSPGLLVADTKFDLVLDPGDFLARAAHLWDAEGAFGQLQNQAYGYIWPMGPFFWLGDMLGAPGWVIQRSWLALVLVAAFAGAVFVVRALGVRSDFACLVAGAAYALSPRMLTTSGPISIEAWPSALAPWVLLPLIVGSRRGSARRAAALSALAVAMVGGVNAVATFAVIPLGVVWVLTRTPGPRRRTLLVWWPTFVFMVTVWWVVPLLIMGSYSPPFLDFIESSAITTFPTTVFDTLRGTSAWIPYVEGSWRAGNDLITIYFLPLNSGLLLVLGLAGLATRKNPERTFLAIGLAVGLLAVTFGHTGAVEGWFAESFAAALDGALAPFRNVHKFDPIVRLPLVVGLAWSVQRLLSEARTLATSSAQRRASQAATVGGGVIATLVAFAVAAAALPALQGRLTPANGMLAVPDYWGETSAWLEDRSELGLALLVPGSGFADYVWGSPRDEPLQALAESRWAVRNAVPLAPAGNIRMLDAIETRFLQGNGSAGLVAALRRAGIRYLIVRNDLQRSGDVVDPVAVHQTLRGLPGVARVATFGPLVGGEAHLAVGDQRIVVNGGWQSTYPAIEVFQVPSPVDMGRWGDTMPLVVGGPEDLLDLADDGLLPDSPAMLAADLDADEFPLGPVIVTDGLLARERFFGRMHDSASAVLTPGDVPRTGNPTRDYRLEDTDRWSTTAGLRGAAAVSASSSMSDANTIGGARTDQLPYAALDGLDGTEWVSGTAGSGRPWWRVTLATPRVLTSIQVVGGMSAAARQQLRVRTQNGVTKPIAVGPGERRSVAVAQGMTGWVEVQAASQTAARLALAEVDLAGMKVQRPLVLPGLPEDWPAPQALMFRALGDARTGCLSVDGSVRCVEDRDREGEEQGGFVREFNLPGAAAYTPMLTVRAGEGPAVERLLQSGELVEISATTRATRDLRSGAISAIDGDPGTTWTAERDDLGPSLTVRWLGPRQVSGLNVVLEEGAAARRPTEVLLVWPGGRRHVSLDEDGDARFARFSTSQLTVQVTEAEPTSGIGFDGARQRFGVGVSELRIRGLDFLPRAPSAVPSELACGSGPTVWVDREPHRSRLTTSPAAMLRGELLIAEFCDPGDWSLAAGPHEIEVVDSSGFVADRLTLLGQPGTLGPVAAAGVTAPDPVTRRVSGPATGALVTDGAVVALPENANPGWGARAAEESWGPVTIDGWQQGYAGRPAGLVARFTPDRAYRWSLGIGLVLLATSAVAILGLPRRRWPGVGDRELGARRLPAGVGLLGVLALGGMLASWWGVVVCSVAAGVVLWTSRRAPDAVEWLAGAGPFMAAVAYAIYPWGSGAWAGELRWPQLVSLASISACLMIAVVATREQTDEVDRPASR